MRNLYVIDASVFVKEDISLGVLSGDIELVGTPAAGSEIAFSHPLNILSFTNDCPLIKSVRIESVLYCIEGDPDRKNVPYLMLADLVFSSVEEANNAMRYLVKGFNLDFWHPDEKYDNQDTW